MILTAAIATRTFDLLGSMYFYGLIDSKSNLQEFTRRMSRTATLDTGAVIDDRGYYAGDRTIEINIPSSQPAYDQLLYIIQNYGTLLIFLPDGAFTGNMQRMKQDNGTISFSFLLETELT